ncbi:hypothetical protein OZX56_01905 [Lactobacillus sp. ESL0684]|uniref:hypothetical protein n=1 Tax=Lactobacillus sp. ESL0684 TaxID=2983213 RepID=UPI0023FA130A|nr:hypothetical protein [Lactobacillus sp. ESL0684]WEV44010.1 hypothetical protein OZX56_01905 [Lactobacillus sp. ESL0684]
MYQLRIYTINNLENAKIYLDVHWTRHIPSLKKYGITTCNVFRTDHQADEEQQVLALVKCDADQDLNELNQKYMASPEFKVDMQGFDMSAIKNVMTIDLVEKA